MKTTKKWYRNREIKRLFPEVGGSYFASEIIAYMDYYGYTFDEALYRRFKVKTVEELLLKLGEQK